MKPRRGTTRAQLAAGFWALFGLWNVGNGVKQLLGVGSAGSLALGVAGGALAAFYVRNPDHVVRGSERVDWRVEAVAVSALAFVATAVAYVLFA